MHEDMKSYTDKQEQEPILRIWRELKAREEEGCEASASEEEEGSQQLN